MLEEGMDSTSDVSPGKLCPMGNRLIENAQIMKATMYDR